MFYVLQELAAFLHGFSRGYAIIHNQYIMYIVHVESFPPFSGLIDMPVAERVYVRDRQVQVERQQVGGKHATAGHADNESKSRGRMLRCCRMQWFRSSMLR